MARLKQTQIDSLEAFVEIALERVAAGEDDVETAKMDIMAIIEACNDGAGSSIMSPSRQLLSTWKGWHLAGPKGLPE